MTFSKLNDKADRYFAIMAEIEALTAEAEEIKDTFKAAMIERETEQLDGDGWRSTWHNTSNSRFDSKRFRAEHADMYAAYTVKSTGVRFTLNVIGA